MANNAATVNLRPLVLQLIADVQAGAAGEGILQEEGQQTTFQVEPHGDIVANCYGGGILDFVFVQYDRLFILYKDGTLVERVSARSPFVDDTPLRHPTTLEQWLIKWATEGVSPEYKGEVKMEPYGVDGAMCILTRVERGVIADFFTENVKLFYDYEQRVVRRYIEPAVSFKRRQRLEAEIAQVQRRRNKQPVEQLGYGGEPEWVDQTYYCNRLVCKCGNVRWVKNADMFQVKGCKPCTAKRNPKMRPKKKEL